MDKIQAVIKKFLAINLHRLLYFIIFPIMEAPKMKKILPFLGLTLFLFSSIQAKVGDVGKVLPTPGPNPTGLAFDGKFLWLADSRLDKIFKMDPISGKVLKSFESPGFHPEGLAWDGHFLWHVDAKEKMLYCLEPETGIAGRG